MSNNSIAQSERINIQLETKQEIVKTLFSYPLVIRELDVTYSLLGKCNEIVSIQESEIRVKDEQIYTLNQIIGNLEDQKELFNKQLRKSKTNVYKVAGVGILSVVAIILVK